MNSELHGHGSGGSGGESPRSTRRGFRILIAYDMPVNALEAMRLSDGMVGHLGEEFALHRDLWWFDILTWAEARGTALRETLDADLIILAADAARRLPVAVENWLSSWADGGGSVNGILVALLNVRLATPLQAGELRSILRRCAEQTGIELFCREFTRSPDDEVRGIPANRKQSGWQASTLTAGHRRCD